MKIWDKLGDNAPNIQALAAIISALLTLGAVIGVKVQIDASAAQQQQQAARDIYREFLNLSLSKPEFSKPDLCAIKGTPQEDAYEEYVEFMLYTFEQMLAASSDWESALSARLEDHKAYLCPITDWQGYTPPVLSLMNKFKAESCKDPIPACAEKGADSQ